MKAKELSIALLLGAILSCQRDASPPRSRGLSTYGEARRAQFSALAQRGRRCHRPLVLVGDSITDWAEWSELLGTSCVLNRGIAGQTAAEVRASLPPLMALKPGVFVVELGVNDLLFERPEAEVRADLKEIVRALISVAPVVVVPILPMDPAAFPEAIPAARLASFNRQLAQDVEPLGARILDLSSIFLDAQGAPLPQRFADGIHPSAEAYQLWAERLWTVPEVRTASAGWSLLRAR
ncbi:MAG: GDSL-type esterase/lipase family protein [Myxococcota bacterium]